MTKVLRKWLILVAMLAAAVSAFAQNDNRRPPKNPDRVVEKPKGEKPPPSNSNQGKGDKGRGKPN